MNSVNLEEMLKEAIKIPSKRSVFLRTLMQSNVFVMCRHAVQKPQPHETVSVELITTQRPEGETFIPFFTSYRAMQIFAKRYVECCEMNCLRFFELIQDNSAVLNPNSYGKEFSSREIKTILKVAQQAKIEAVSVNENTRIKYMKPKYVSSHIVKAASKFFAKHENVNQAYIMDMVKDGGTPQILIVIDMEGGTRKLFLGLADAISKSVKYGLRYADGIYFISMEQDNIKEAVKNQIPFYIKSDEEPKKFFRFG